MIRRKPRVVKVCSFCKKRKIKCDKGNPCSSCVKHNNSICEYVQPDLSDNKNNSSLRLNSLYSKLSRLSDRLPPNDYEAVLDAMEHVIKSGQLSVKQNVPFAKVYDGPLAFADEDGVETQKVVQLPFSDMTDSSSSTEGLNYPTTANNSASTDTNYEVAGFAVVDQTQNFGVSHLPTKLTSAEACELLAGFVPKGTSGGIPDLFQSLTSPVAPMANILDYQSSQAVPRPPDRPESDSGETLINFYDHKRHNWIKSDCPLSILGVLSSDMVLANFHRKYYMNDYHLKQELIADFSVSNIDIRNRVNGIIQKDYANNIAQPDLPLELLLTYQDEENIADMNLGLNPHMSMLDLVDKILQALPPLNVICELTTCFFTSAYVYMPVLDQSDIRSKVFELFYADILSQKVTSIAIRSLDDLASLGILLLVIRIGGLTKLNLQDASRGVCLNDMVSSQLYRLAEFIAAKLTFQKTQNLLITQLLFLLKCYRLFGPECGYGDHGLIGEKDNLFLPDLCRNLGYDDPAPEHFNENEKKNHNLGTKVFLCSLLIDSLSTTNVGTNEANRKWDVGWKIPYCKNNADEGIDRASLVILRWIPIFVKKLAGVRESLKPETLTSIEEWFYLLQITEAEVVLHMNVVLGVKQGFETEAEKSLEGILKGGQPILSEDQQNPYFMRTIIDLRFRNVCSLYSSKLSINFHLYTTLFESHNVEEHNKYFVRIIDIIYEQVMWLVKAFFTDPTFREHGWFIAPHLNIMMGKMMVILFSMLLKTQIVLQLSANNDAKVRLTLFCNLISITLRACLKYVQNAGLDRVYYSCWKYSKLGEKFLRTTETIDVGTAFDSLDQNDVQALMASFEDAKLMDSVCSKIIKSIKSINLDHIVLKDGVESYNEIYQFLRAER